MRFRFCYFNCTCCPDRVGDYKLIYGTVGVTTVIPDEPFKCADCCPLKRPPLPPPGGKAR